MASTSGGSPTSLDEKSSSPGAGNDVISIHYGRGTLDCGPGRDVYHVARTRKAKYKIRNCEKVDYRPESQRGALKPLN